MAFVGGVVGVGHYPLVDAEDGAWFEDAEDLGVDAFEGGRVDGGFDGVGCVESVFGEVDFLGERCDGLALSVEGEVEGWSMEQSDEP